MRTLRVSLCLPCVLSLALFTTSVARAEDDPAAARLGLRARIGGAIGNVVKAVDNGVTQITGRLEFRKWIKNNEDVRGRYYVEKEKQGAAGADLRAGMWGVAAGVGVAITATGGGVCTAIPTALAALNAGQYVKQSISCRERARISTVSHMLNDPGVKIPAAVLKLQKIDLEKAIGRNERSIVNSQEDVIRAQAEIKTANAAIAACRAEIEKVNSSLPPKKP